MSPMVIPFYALFGMVAAFCAYASFCGIVCIATSAKHRTITDVFCCGAFLFGTLMSACIILDAAGVKL